MYTPLYIPTPLKPIFSSKSLFFLATPSSSFFFKRMGHLIEEKALGDDHQRGDSLEEKISLFFDEEDEELDRNSEGDWADDEAANNELHDPIERKEFWDSQEALLLVLFFFSFSVIFFFTDNKACLDSIFGDHSWIFMCLFWLKWLSYDDYSKGLLDFELFNSSKEKISSKKYGWSSFLKFTTNYFDFFPSFILWPTRIGIFFFLSIFFSIEVHVDFI